ncbi:hypothetical protein AZE42_01206 [Rhizopogon vesiculosus]|uniref:Uncharacterized protein n=1 Tax=Rhizopogon vesiculosus TaxID=180088 RepID=A0A1J8Q9D2_9AGAM|nr:hypothetical protein AZE42_01206 [Rhizopogon vesiculosus]
MKLKLVQFAYLVIVASVGTANTQFGPACNQIVCLAECKSTSAEASLLQYSVLSGGAAFIPGKDSETSDTITKLITPGPVLRTADCTGIPPPRIFTGQNTRTSNQTRTHRLSLFTVLLDLLAYTASTHLTQSHLLLARGFLAFAVITEA